ncbi:uncharacterized protein LOC119833283 [Zerene cesonia]|uniref:uncharacterized protein LOC119833283 n=1 Tax=Zerene cesonia TaxID=33412 RepID=UPI0018E4DC87|nr:uncharacterized protein LOC119833283 [Zerene cesonia]
MALCACKCLNVILQCDKMEEIIDIERLELSPTEQRDIFFSEKLISCPLSSLRNTVVQSALVGDRVVGRWTLESCLACGQTTFAKLQEKDLALVNKSIQTTQENIINLKKATNYSPVFNLLVPDLSNDADMKENIDTNNHVISTKNNLSSMAVIGLRKQLNQNLQSQLEAIEEAVRQYKEQKYAEYEAYRERAQRDHKILSSIISKTRNNADNEGWMNNNSVDNGPPSPLAPPLQRRRLSSLKDAKKFTHNVEKTNAQIPHEEDSLDAEDIFDLEGMDSRNMASDFDDYDSDPEGSNDEGIHIARGRGAPADIARSLPVSVPVYPHHASHADVDDFEETQDIAASIKALARSVHGDVFELPRPRFSTQI